MENYFSANILHLRKKKGLNQTELADFLGKKKSIIGPYEKGEVEPDIKTLLKVSDLFGISVSDLIGKDLTKGVHLTVHPTVHPKLKESEEKYTKKVYTEHVIDTAGMKLVPIVDIKAAAGAGYINAENLEAEDVIHLPATLLKSGYHLCIRVKGPSMAPTFQDGGYLIIRLLDKAEWGDVLNERCYVIVDNEGKNYIKRVKNRFRGDKEGFLVCTSDNPDKISHPNFNLHPHEIMFLWYVEWYFTAKMPNIHDQYYSRVSNLEDKVDLLAEEVREVKKQLK